MTTCSSLVVSLLFHMRSLFSDALFLVSPSFGASEVCLVMLCFSSLPLSVPRKFVLSCFVSHLSFFRCLGRAVLCGCGISCVSPLLFLRTNYKSINADHNDEAQFF